MKRERTGSWKTCEDYWLAIRPDGTAFEADTMKWAAWLLCERLDEEVEERRKKAAGEAMLADLDPEAL